ncbi:MAG: hypothetical protein ACTTH3_01260 [Schwartzia sp. (in: firmicutes)]
MSRLVGYGRTLRQYWQTPKGRWDIKEYARAAFFIALTIAAAMAGLWGLLAFG